MQSFHQWLEEIQPIGQCFTWACKQAMLDKNIIIYHGIVHDSWKNTSYPHAWIEKNGKIFDWQMEEMGGGGKFNKKGYPPDIFKEIYSPQNVKKYSPKELLENRKKYGHCGPWDESAFIENRTVGRSLPETGYEYKYVNIYRAMGDENPIIKNMDYVTRSLKFAKEHAEHQFAIEEIPQIVVKAMVKADNVFEAYNPGEYFYKGEPIRGKIVYKKESHGF
jgi:hypothetical protein